MARYLQTAKKANEAIKQLLTLVEPQNQTQATVIAAQLVNLGFRCNPRAAAGTIRLNTVRTALADLPVDAKFTACTTSSGKTFNALTLTSRETNTDIVSEEEDSVF